MNFGKFDESKLFYIEASKVYKELGTGIKTVEFILKHNEDSIIFLEAKKTCPNVANRYESVDKEQKFVLVVKNAKNESWLAGPLAELKNRLLQVRKIWGVKVMVLNEELAKEYKLIC